jgi:hypothetical protein
MAQAHEFVDVELVVGEQHEVLEPLGRRAGVVAQAVQRVVHPRRGEQRQGLRLARAGSQVPLAMPSSMAARSGRSNTSRISMRRSGVSVPSTWSCSANEKWMGMGWLLVPTSSSTPWLLQQQAKLLGVVVGKQVGPREGGLKAAGAFDEAVARPCQGRRAQRLACRHGGGQRLAGKWLAPAPAHSGHRCGVWGSERWDVDHAHVRRMGDQVVSWLRQPVVSSAVMPP